MPLGHVARVLHFGILIYIRLNNLERLPKGLDVGIVLILRIVIIGKYLGDGRCVTSLFVDNVRFGWVDDSPFVDGIGSTKVGIIAKLNPILVLGYLLHILKLWIQHVGICILFWIPIPDHVGPTQIAFIPCSPLINGNGVRVILHLLDFLHKVFVVPFRHRPITAVNFTENGLPALALLLLLADTVVGIFEKFPQRFNSRSNVLLLRWWGTLVG
mmetsp:Transcript_21862/g.47295  ORF Transcript_21862/g.47295 Transcript_21862/m.47295 type:complete len:214 (-) Transcript_21862:679-1320(-)